MDTIERGGDPAPAHPSATGRPGASGRMRAAIVERYGPPSVVRVASIPKPRPRRGECLVRVDAAAVTAGDARIRGASFPRGFDAVSRLVFGLRGPRQPVLGGVFSGVVDAVGDGVGADAGANGVAIGDRVCGMTGMRLGTHAEFVRVPVRACVRVPDEVEPESAAAVLFGGTTALHFLRRIAHLERGQTVLVNGASGAVGSSAVQLARILGARVAGVTSAANAELVRALGAERAIDYTAESLDEIAARGDRFDLVLDAVGNLGTRLGTRLLSERGMLLLAVASLWQTLTARGRVRAGTASERPDDMRELLRLLADGELDPVIDRTCTLDTIADAYARIDSGRKVGSIVLTP